jgi:hypothetical protein
MVSQCERPYPRRSDWRRIGLEDSADHNAIGKHVEIVVVPLAEARLRISGIDHALMLVERGEESGLVRAPSSFYSACCVPAH